MNGSDPRREPAIGVLIACTLGAILGVVAVRFAATAYQNHASLEKTGVQATARVTGARTMQERSGPSFEIQYAFEVAGRAETFTLGDETGGQNLWTSMDGEPEWLAAQQTGQVQVLYLPSDPNINRLLTRRGNPLGDPGAGVVLGLLLVAASSVIGWQEATGRGARWRRFADSIRAALHRGG